MRRGFSMVELVIVVVIAGIIAAIAIPRVTGFAERSRERRIVADVNTLQKATEMFGLEHGGLAVGKTNAGATVDWRVLRDRLTHPTDDAGDVDKPNGIMGPYLQRWPNNVLNGKGSVRIDGAAAGAGTHGWRYDSALNIIQSDEPFEATLPDGSTVDHKGVVKTVADLALPGP